MTATMGFLSCQEISFEIDSYTEKVQRRGKFQK